MACVSRLGIFSLLHVSFEEGYECQRAERFLAELRGSVSTWKHFYD